MIIDANVFLRYILDDSVKQSPIAANIIDNNEIHLPNEVLAEIVYVLEKVYKVPRKTIKKIFFDFLDKYKIIVPNPELIKQTLNKYSTTKLDFIDCILFGYSIVEKEKIITFDKELLKELEKNI
ncbi:MAG: type II toxin-antitoxin system VapC family toxin [Bacteroidetes bacterium]|nr:MAG: type II toxin-antitoxin system VapC family toxin [Bacteroidota bacterium]